MTWSSWRRAAAPSGGSGAAWQPPGPPHRPLWDVLSLVLMLVIAAAMWAVATSPRRHPIARRIWKVAAAVLTLATAGAAVGLGLERLPWEGLRVTGVLLQVAAFFIAVPISAAGIVCGAIRYLGPYTAVGQLHRWLWDLAGEIDRGLTTIVEWWRRRRR
jgi:hypothetical protein